jgi:phage-related protein (TIGR01555 family)
MANKLTNKKNKTKASLDGFVNFTAALGVGANNQLSQSTYRLNPKTRVPIELEYAYRGSWIVAAAVDLPAEDMCRAGIEINSPLSPEETDAIQEEISSLGLWSSLTNCIKWARLYGGSLAYIMIDGQDPEEELNLDSIDIGQFKGIMALDRWMVMPSYSDTIIEMGKDFGLPRYYDLVADRSGFAGHLTRIHHSRLIRFVGIDLPFRQMMTENGWGESIIERIHDRLISYDSITTGAAQLAYKAHLRVMKIDGMRQIVSAGGAMLNGLNNQMAYMRQSQANEGIAVIDSTDSLEALTYSFAGLDTLMDKFSEQISGALQIPLVRLLGQSPGGLNSSGESDLITYYDGIAKHQESKLRQPLSYLLDILSRSVVGKEIPRGTRFKFNPLWLPKESETAEIASKNTNSIIAAYNAGLISREEARDEFRQSTERTKLYSNIKGDGSE